MKTHSVSVSVSVTFFNEVTVTVEPKVFNDMLTAYAECLYSRQEKIRAEISNLPLDDPGVGAMFHSLLDQYHTRSLGAKSLQEMQLALGQLGGVG